MKQKDVFSKIGGILKELNEQYQYLQINEADLNELEIELFIANAHFLKDHAEILNKLVIRAVSAKAAAPKPEPAPAQQDIPAAKPHPLPAKPETPVDKPKDKEKYFEPVVHQLKHADRASEPNNDIKPVKNNTVKEPEADPGINLDAFAPVKDSYSFMRETPEPEKSPLSLSEAGSEEKDTVKEALAEEPLTNTVEETLPETLPAESEPAKTSKHEAEAENVSIKKEDGPAEEKVLTVNQKMSSQLDQKSKQQPAKPIADLKLAITMNDKMLYVKELFNGYNLAYSEAIEILNRFNTFEEASRFLKTNYVTKNKWDSKPGTTEKFYALLQRRYPPVL